MNVQTQAGAPAFPLAGDRVYIGSKPSVSRGTYGDLCLRLQWDEVHGEWIALNRPYGVIAVVANSEDLDPESIRGTKMTVVSEGYRSDMVFLQMDDE